MRRCERNFLAAMAVAMACGASAGLVMADGPAKTVGVVGHVKVVSDKVQDVSSLESWKKSFIKDGMSDKDKALAVFNTEVSFQQADAPAPAEYLQREGTVLDPIKDFNVYGYTFCSISSANIACLARYAGLKARNCTVNNHTIPEMFYNNSWHMMDADLIEYYPKKDGEIASVPELVAGIDAWLKDHPDFSVALNDKQKRYKYMNDNNWKTNGPEILSRNPFYADSGWLPCAEFAWGDTVQQFSKLNNTWQSCYSMGYEVNVELRQGERLTRNWFNKGLFLGKDDGGGTPESLNAKVGQGSFRQSPKWGDLAPGRIGNGTLEYDVPLANGEFRGGVLTADNLAAKSEDKSGAAVHVKDAAKDAVLEIRMPSSYVYLGGQMTFTSAVADGGEIKVLLSDNNGLDWKDVATVAPGAGEQKIDLKPFILRRYSYQVRFVLKGKGTGLDALKFTEDIQNSQRALPALAQGENKIAFSAGPAEGTITVEGAMELPAEDAGKQLRWTDFHPQVDGFDATKMPSSEGKGSVTFPVKTPGDMTCLRASDYFISQGTDSMFVIDVSFDDGKTWKTIDQPKPEEFYQEGRKYLGRYAKATDMPAGTRSALVRYRGVGNNTITLCNARIDADYKEPAGGFAPVKVTYVWEESGVEKKDVHVAKSATEAYTIKCDATPVMKSLVLELAK